MSIARLHFVYNVEATPRALAKDFIHRLSDPDTYPCRLCDITYGRFVKKPGWILFLRRLPVRSRFYTKDRFQKLHPKVKATFPVVLAEDRDGRLKTFISAADMARLASLDQLKAEVSERLASSGPAAKSRRRQRA